MMDGLYPNLYFSACSKYVYSTQLWIYTEISILTPIVNRFYELIMWNFSAYKMYSLSPIQFVSQIFVGRQNWNGPISPPLL